MSNFESVDAVLDFAIAGEEESAEYYHKLAKMMDRPWMADIFLEFAKEEMKHKGKLMAVKQGKTLVPSQKKVQDLKIADYTVEVVETPDMTYQEALVVAMKREKASFKLYNHLADSTEDKDLEQTFLALAQEEAKHKLRIELEYDDQILKDN